MRPRHRTTGPKPLIPARPKVCLSTCADGMWPCPFESHGLYSYGRARLRAFPPNSSNQCRAGRCRHALDMPTANADGQRRWSMQCRRPMPTVNAMPTANADGQRAADIGRCCIQYWGIIYTGRAGIAQDAVGRHRTECCFLTNTASLLTHTSASHRAR